MNIFFEIFGGRELTLTPTELPYAKGTFVLDKWHRKRRPVEIPVEIAKYLIDCGILILDSGNWETGEEHYIYNKECGKLSSDKLSSDNIIFEKLKPILREIRLNELIK